MASLVLGAALVAASSACAGKPGDGEVEYPDPGPVVNADGQPIEIDQKYELETPEDFAATEADARAAMRWYIHALPPARPDLWVRARDLVYDWIEGQEDTLGVRPNMAVLGLPERDRKWKFTPYVRGVYLAGKTLYVLEHPDAAGTMAAEIAGVEAMLEFHEVTQASGDPMGSSPKLERYERKLRRGKLEAYLQKRIDKGKD